MGKNRGGIRLNSEQCDRGQTEQERRDSPFGFALSLPVDSTYTHTHTHTDGQTSLSLPGLLH